MPRCRPTVLILSLLAIALAGSAPVAAQPVLEGRWKSEMTADAAGQKLPIILVLDLKTDATGAVSGEMVVTAEISKIVPFQEDQVQRRSVEGQYDAPDATLVVSGEGDGESAGRTSDGGQPLIFRGEGQERIGRVSDDGQRLTFQNAESGEVSSVFERVE